MRKTNEEFGRFLYITEKLGKVLIHQSFISQGRILKLVPRREQKQMKTSK